MANPPGRRHAHGWPSARAYNARKPKPEPFLYPGSTWDMVQGKVTTLWRHVSNVSGILGTLETCRHRFWHPNSIGSEPCRSWRNFPMRKLMMVATFCLLISSWFLAPADEKKSEGRALF